MEETKLMMPGVRRNVQEVLEKEGGAFQEATGCVASSGEISEMGSR